MSDKRKRSKATLVCTNCKKRKIKCDRKMPCSTCVKSNSGYSCTYESKWHPISFPGGDEQSIDKRMNDSNFMQTTLADFRAPSPSVRSETPTKHMIHEYGHYASPQPKEHGDPALDELALLRSKLNELENSLKRRDHDTQSASSTHSDQHADFSRLANILRQDIGKHADEEIINFYDGCAPIQGRGTFRRTSYGPLAWVSLMKKDPWLSLVWKSLDTKNQSSIPMPRVPQVNAENNQVFNTPPDSSGTSSSQETLFQKRTLEMDGYGEIVPFRTLLNLQNKNVQSNLNFTNMTLAKTLFEGKISPEIQLVERIKQMLPKKRVLWTLIDRFFRTLYPFLPFLDEAEFKKDLSAILGPISYADESLDKVNIEKKLDLAFIAICLFVLRITYVSIFSNRDCVNVHRLQSDTDPEIKYLLSNPINIAVIDVARACIMCFQVSRKFNFTVFQAVLFMRLYSNHAPEEGDGIDGGDSQVAQGGLVQMAYSLGLHREPDKFEDPNLDEKTKHIGRKIWHFLYRTDVVNCYSIGNLPVINERFFDTKIPFATPKNTNISDISMEKQVCQSFAFSQDELVRFDNVLTYILDIRRGCHVSSLMESLDKVDSFCNNKLNVFRLYPDSKIIPLDYDPDDMLKIYKTRVFIAAKSSLITIFFHMYLHYEGKTKFESSFYFLMKIYTIITDDLLPYFFEVLYGRMSHHAFLLNPTVLTAIHKSNQFCLSNLTRINYLKFSMETKPDHDARLKNDFEYNVHYKRILSLSNKIRGAIDAFVKLFEKFSSRYYYAWRITKAHRLLLKFLKREDFYKRPTPSVKKLHSFQYTANQLEQITKTIQRLSKSADAVVSYEDKHDKEPENPVFIKPSSTGGRPNEMSVTSMNNNLSQNHSISKTPTSTSDTPESSHSINNQYLDQMWLSMMAMKDSDAQTPFINDYYMMDPSMAHRPSLAGLVDPRQNLGRGQEDDQGQDQGQVPTKQSSMPQGPQLAQDHPGNQPPTNPSSTLPPNMAMPIAGQRPTQPLGPFVAPQNEERQNHQYPVQQSLFNSFHHPSYLDHMDHNMQTSVQGDESAPFYFNSDSDLVGLYNLEQLLN